MEPLLTVGHGAWSAPELASLLTAAGVSSVVDVRRFPGSRSSPHLHTDRLADWLPESGVAYRWEERLGGRRRLPTGAPVVDGWWRVAAFQAYAAYTRTPDFAGGMQDLLEQVRRPARRVAVMCSELVWWRCHRRIVADVAVLAHDCPVQHLMPDGSLRAHVVSDGARLLADGQVTWPAADPQGEEGRPIRQNG